MMPTSRSRGTHCESGIEHVVSPMALSIVFSESDTLCRATAARLGDNWVPSRKRRRRRREGAVRAHKGHGSPLRGGGVGSSLVKDQSTHVSGARCFAPRSVKPSFMAAGAGAGAKKQLGNGFA
ncbi:hypothetical protein NliqN6_5928 [Naganishia liquefaciens]|uniref:Uncharacterized protein n=1 Tax=Naganishia liquefaciens TaxID=104408 RepID=A0A8H3TZ35_9TREE|nr:hypothetical protein NliqN6_5928 [Naganishia liquefaciens]